MSNYMSKLDEIISEMAAMGTGAVAGPPTKKEPVVEEEEELSEEEQTEALLRKHIRERVAQLRSKQIKNQMVQEEALRKIIRGLLAEAEDANPHPNTGINKLRDAFKKARPTIRRLYKQLTSSDEQRQSFVAHLLSGFQRMFDEVDALSGIQSAEATPTNPQTLSAPPDDVLATPPEGDSDINVSVTDDEPDMEDELGLMDLSEIQIISEEDQASMEKELEKKQGLDAERESFGSGLEDMDRTGRNQALDTMKLIKSYYSEPYGDLENDEDRKQFKDWALYNLDLLLKSYEDELQAGLQKPDIAMPGS